MTVPTTNLWAYYEADSFNALANGGAISTPWLDKSGNGKHIPVLEGAPKFATNQIGGTHPALAFGFTDTVIDSFAPLNMSALTAGEVFIVQKVAVGGVNNATIKMGTSGNTDTLPRYDGAITTDFGSGEFRSGGAPTDYQPLSGTWKILNAHSALNDWEFYVDEVLVLSDNTNVVAFPANGIIGRGDIPARYDYCMRGHIAGVYIYSAKLDPATRASVYSYIKTALLGLIIVTTTSVPNAVLNEIYSQQLQVDGGIGAKTWSLDAGSGPLPNGLTLSSSGLISGTATVGGSFSFTVKATDSTAQSDTQALTIVVAPYSGPPRFPDPTITGIIWEHFEPKVIDYSATTVTHVYEDEGRSFNETTTSPAMRWDVTFTGLSFDESAIYENFARTVRLVVPFTFKDKWGVVWNNVRVDTYERSHSRNMSWSHNVHFVLVQYP